MEMPTILRQPLHSEFEDVLSDGNIFHDIGHWFSHEMDSDGRGGGWLAAARAACMQDDFIRLRPATSNFLRALISVLYTVFIPTDSRYVDSH